MKLFSSHDRLAYKFSWLVLLADTQVRKMTIKILINMAEERLKHRQFIFITPQDLSSVTPRDTLKIFKLKPPERNQIAGGLTQQTLDFSQS